MQQGLSYLHLNANAYAHIFVSNDDTSSFLALLERVRIEARLVNDTMPTNLTAAQQHIEQLQDRLDDIIDIENYFTVKSVQFDNSTVNALLLANIVDEVLTHYGGAYGILPNIMLNTSYMSTGLNPDKNRNGEKMSMPNNTQNKQQYQLNNYTHNINSSMKNNNTKKIIPSNNNDFLINIAKYQTAKEYAKRAIEIFNIKLKPFETGRNANAMNELEKGLVKLRNAIDNKVQPMEIMMIAHGKIHPSLQVAFNLKVKK